MTIDEVLKKGRETSRKIGFVVFFFAVSKAVIGLISGSVALLSDSLHSIGDAFSVLFVWLGFKISQRKPTKKFPYGFYKVENIIALIISFLILYGGFEIFKESFKRVFVFQPITLPWAALFISFLDGIIIFLVGRYELRVGNKINSQTLIALGKESKLHIFSSSAVLLGILSSYFGIHRVEGIVGILLSFFVFEVGIESARDSIFGLMDVSPSKRTERRIRKALNSLQNIENFSNLRLRKSGPFVFGEVDVEVKKFIEIKKADEIVDDLKEKIKKSVPEVDSLSIHIKPFKKTEQKVIVPVQESKGTDSQIDEHFARARFFAIVRVKKEKIESLRFKENHLREKQIRTGLAVAKELLKEKPDVLITKDIGPISFHAFRDGLVEIYEVKKKNLGQIIDDFLNNKLKRLRNPTREKE